MFIRQNSMQVLIVVPTLNEELVIGRNIVSVMAIFERILGDHDWKVVVADNGSKDHTREIVGQLMTTYPHLDLWTTAQRGKGLAVREAWKSRKADVYVFMDADLSTDPADVIKLLAALQTADVAVGSRLHPDAQVDRSFGREIVSRCYRLLAGMFVTIPLKDYQCGFKAMRREAFDVIKNDWTHDDWFFDTEILAFAHKRGLTIAEVPIRWQETLDARRKSSMNVLRLSLGSIKQLRRLRRRLSHQSLTE